MRSQHLKNDYTLAQKPAYAALAEKHPNDALAQ
jgi:hypothetical protein